MQDQSKGSAREEEDKGKTLWQRVCLWRRESEGQKNKDKQAKPWVATALGLGQSGTGTIQGLLLYQRKLYPAVCI